eukprot:TRINITY_DN57564_c0_g1_i1.p1 TRINITY_DN57564_c0_g1~~TRINITY_DN57564_c0_g1_i1.p1  ORF type:complete len:108 (+),score=29.36 TRINITY_DN57564_c0_g1_i1:99-422(+)
MMRSLALLPCLLSALMVRVHADVEQEELEKAMKDAMQELDGDGDGYVSLDDLTSSVLTSDFLDEETKQSTMNEIKAKFATADLDRDGKLSETEFRPFSLSMGGQEEL